MINEAQGQYNKEVYVAEGVKDQNIEAAEGYALKRVNEAEGDAARFRAVLEEFEKAPEITKTRLYLEAPERSRASIGQKDNHGRGRIPSVASLATSNRQRRVRQMKFRTQTILFLILVPSADLFLLYLSTYVVRETDQVIITRFGQVRGNPVKDPGLHWKMPFIDDANRIEKRYQPWDGPASEMSTKDKTYLIIDTYARWRISEPKKYFLRLRDERRALSRLDDILGSETRNAVAKYELIEIVRSDKDREIKSNQSLTQASESSGQSYAIDTGRTKIQDEIKEKAALKLNDFGIQLLDLRFKRINYNETVQRRYTSE